MKITDLKASESSQVGDTILSANDLSNKFIERTNQQTLNKLEYPKLWELYKVSTGDKFIDRNIYTNSTTNTFTDFIETDNRYLFLNSPGTLSFRIFNKHNMNLLSSVSSGITATANIKFLSGDNNHVIINENQIISNTSTIRYSSDFDIENGTIGTFTTKVIDSSVNSANITKVVFLNDYFLICVNYSSSRFIYFKINKTELSDIENITGVFNTDVLLTNVLFDSETFITTNSLAVTTITSINNVFLENEDIYIYNNSTKAIYKSNHTDPYDIEVYEQLSLSNNSNTLKSIAYYKNSFIMSFIKTNLILTPVVFLINDNGIKIKQDSSINTVIPNNNAEILYCDFINKKLITKNTPGGNVENILYYNNFNMNLKTESVFNVALQSTVFYPISNSSSNNTGSFIFYYNKNPIFMRISNAITLENGSNQYDTFKADFIEGNFPDNFIMPSIVGNTKDKYWTKKG